MLHGAAGIRLPGDSEPAPQEGNLQPAGCKTEEVAFLEEGSALAWVDLNVGFLWSTRRYKIRWKHRYLVINGAAARWREAATTGAARPAIWTQAKKPRPVDVEVSTLLWTPATTSPAKPSGLVFP
ncbi:Myomesin-1 [Manis pentadactyla]|nr:Myomesin-1 [Manis pentadactyla]